MKNMNKTNVLKISISLLMLILAVIGFSMAACSNGSTDPIPQTVATPTASPPAGTYAAAQSVTLNTATAGASIYYTTNDSTPTTGSTLYNGAITISATTTLKAIAVKEGMNNSAVLTAVYTISGSSRPTAINITINKTGDETGDSITASPTSGQIGDEITINYTLANTKHNNRLVFSGTTAPITEVDIAETGTRTYTIAQEDVADETITINAVFTHSDKTLDTIAFADTNNETRTYGTATFTKAISNTGTGTRTITYSSSDTAVATVDETSGAVTIKKVGKTTITATKAEDATYAQATAEYELTIDKLQLTITDPTVTATKVYDGNTNAAVTAIGNLTNTVVGDTVTVSAEANYNSADVGNNINITVVYSIEGTDKDNYIKPVNYTTSGSITAATTPVTLISVTPNGSDTQTTTQLTLTFSEAIPGLSADDITVTGVEGVSKGTLTGSNPYILQVSVPSNGTLTVTVSKPGYIISDSGSPKTAEIYNALGITWTAVTNSTFGTNSICSIAYGNGKWVAGGNSGKMAYSTDDGVTWIAVENSTFDSGYIYIAYGNDKFVAMGATDGITHVAYSSDGVIWTAVVDSIDEIANILAFTYVNGKFVATGTTSGSPYAAYSSDGITWTTGYQEIRVITYGNGKFVAGGYQGTMAYSTDDGITWISVDVNSTLGDTDIRAIAYGNGKFVAAGGDDDDGKMAYSTDDGVTWTAVAVSPFTSIIRAIAYVNGKWIAVGNAGKMATSTDGTTWTAVEDSKFGTSPNNILGIAYGNGKFVAVGSNGKITWSE